MLENGIVEERKNLKRNRVISTLRYSDEISRHDVKKLTGYSMTTVLSVISGLLERGLITEEDCTSVRTGRRPTWLHLRPEGAYAIGVEFNADRLNCAVVDFGYEVIYHSAVSIDQSDSTEVLISKLTGAVRGALEFLHDARDRVLGIGLGMPGVLDRTKGAGLSYAYLQAWRDVPIRQMLENEFGCPVLLENNVNTLAVAYRWETYRQQAEDFVFVSLQYGIRMATFINNQLFSGGGNAGEIGHIRVANGLRFCQCGKRGCLDTEVSSRAIRVKIRERMECGRFAALRQEVGNDLSLVNMNHYAELLGRGDPDARELMEEVAAYLGQSLAIVLGALNPRRVILASRNGLGGKEFADAVQRVLQEYTSPGLMEGFHVDCIRVPDYFGAQGAAMLVMQDEFQVGEEAL